MTISISEELEAEIRAKANAQGISVDAYVERLIREDEEWGEQLEEPLTQADPEFAETRTAVLEGLEQAEHGEGRPAEEVFEELRTKHGLSR